MPRTMEKPGVYQCRAFLNFLKINKKKRVKSHPRFSISPETSIQFFNLLLSLISSELSRSHSDAYKNPILFSVFVAFGIQIDQTKRSISLEFS